MQSGIRPPFSAVDHQQNHTCTQHAEANGGDHQGPCAAGLGQSEAQLVLGILHREIHDTVSYPGSAPLTVAVAVPSTPVMMMVIGASNRV